jgi:IS30 family transposase
MYDGFAIGGLGGCVVMTANKHMNLSQRIVIEKMLNDKESFKSIARKLDKDCTTVSKEVRLRRIFRHTGAYGRAFNDCLQRHNCLQTGVCDKPGCTKKRCCCCGLCVQCCHEYKKESCSFRQKPPYVCNGCEVRQKCTLEKSLYQASTAQREYEKSFSESHSGLVIDEAEALRLDRIVSPLVRKGQSIHHICTHHGDEIMFSEKTIYNYYDSGVFSTRNLDLPRKVRYRQRRSKHDLFKRDRSCRTGRSYNDFLDFMQQNPDVPITEMDTVEGVKGGSVLLTIHFTDSRFMLAFLRTANTAASVTEVFNSLYGILGHELFEELFPVLLTDNGSEFSNPCAIECDSEGKERTRIFYCDPSCPYQKGAAENNHELIRRIVRKGLPFEPYAQEDIALMMNHVNSYARKTLGRRSPYETFQFLHGADALKKLGAAFIPPDEITLHPSLLKKK